LELQGVEGIPDRSGVGVPNLDAFTLKKVAKVTGLSLAACSRIRAGAKLPHPRQWEALLGLIERDQPD
jgi:hypothetical protein